MTCIGNFFPPPTIGGPYIPLSFMGVPNGVATLGSDGLVPFSQLPDFVVFVSTPPVAPWTTTQTYVLDTGVNAGTSYYSDGTNIYTNQTGTGIQFQTLPTQGNRVTFSVGILGDYIEETLIVYDDTPGSETWDRGGLTQTGTTNFDSNYIGNYDGSELNFTDVTMTMVNTDILMDVDSYFENLGDTVLTDLTVDGDTIFNGDVDFDGSTITYTDVTENYLGNPTVISCEVTPVFGSLFTYVALTQYVEAILVYNNGVDAPITRTLSFTPDSGVQTRTFTTASTTDQVQITANLTDYQIDVVTAGVAFFTITSFCYRNGVSVNNYQHKIHNYDGDIFNNNNTTENNTNSNVTYDANSSFTNLGDTNLTNLNVTNLTINGLPLGLIRSDETPSGTVDGVNDTFTLAHTPSSGSLFVFVNGLVQKVTTDYSITGNSIQFVTPPIVSDVLRSKYVY